MHWQATHVLPVSGEMGKLHHLVAKLAENLDEFLEGADSFQMVQGNQDLTGVKRSDQRKGGGGEHLQSSRTLLVFLKKQVTLHDTLKGHNPPTPY